MAGKPHEIELQGSGLQYGYRAGKEHLQVNYADIEKPTLATGFAIESDDDGESANGGRGASQVRAVRSLFRGGLVIQSGTASCRVTAPGRRSKAVCYPLLVSIYPHLYPHVMYGRAYQSCHAGVYSFRLPAALARAQTAM